MHFMALHVNGSSNPVGISGNMDRIPMHSYFVFKDLITVFIFILFFSLFVFYSPNTMGQIWPLYIIYIIIFSVTIKLNNIIKSLKEITAYYVVSRLLWMAGFIYLYILHRAICWKYSLLYNKTINIRGLYTVSLMWDKLKITKWININLKNIKKYIMADLGWATRHTGGLYVLNASYKRGGIGLAARGRPSLEGRINANPFIVKYYYKEYNQQITNIYKYIIFWWGWLTDSYILVGISETIRTHKIIYIKPAPVYSTDQLVDCWRGAGSRTSRGHNIIILLYLCQYIYKGLLIKDSRAIYNIIQSKNTSLYVNNIIFKRSLSLCHPAPLKEGWVNDSFRANQFPSQRGGREITLKNKSVSDNKFNEWLAGLIDGDGCFGVVNKKYTNCEITVGLEDEKMLRQIQDRFGGLIRLRSGVKAIRFRLRDKESMIKLINAVNGNIRHSTRLAQLHRVCAILNIKLKTPEPLTFNNAWFSGFFDADGTVNYYYRDKNIISKVRPQLILSVSNKLLIDIQAFKDTFGGNIYYDKGKLGTYKWSIGNYETHSLYYEYNKINPSRSFKGQRIFLFKEFYSLYNIKAFRLNNISQYKAWLTFENKWNKTIFYPPPLSREWRAP